MKQSLDNDTEAYDSFRDWARKAVCVKINELRTTRLRAELAQAEISDRIARSAEHDAWAKLQGMRKDHTGIEPFR